MSDKQKITYPVFLCCNYPKEVKWLEVLSAGKATEVIECKHKTKVDHSIRIFSGKGMCGFYFQQLENKNNRNISVVQEHEFRSAYKKVLNKICGFR